MANYDNNKYYFYNQITKEVLYCTRRALVQRYKLDGSSISKVVHGKAEHHKGWLKTTAQFANYIKPRVYTISRKQRIEADKEWDMVLSNLRMWQAKNGIENVVSISELLKKG